MASASQRLALFSFLLAALLVWYYASFLAGQASFYIYDLYAGWQPFLTFMGERLRQGHLPLWDPNSLSGMSHAAVIAPSLFYPLYVLFAFLPFNAAFALMLIIQQLVAGVGTYLLVRSYGWGGWSAAFAGGAFALCGVIFSLQVNPTLQGTAAWLMFAMWSQRIIDTSAPSHKLLRCAFSAVCVYMLVTAGVPEYFAPGLLFMGFTAAWQWWQARKQQGRSPLWTLALRWLALGLGVLMAAAAILPAAEWSKLSPRAAGLPLSELFAWSSNWYDWLNIIAPQALGDLYDPYNPFRPLVAESPNNTPYLENPFIGPILITLAFWGAFDKTWSWKQRIWPIGILLVASIASFGSNIPALVKLVQILNLRFFRYPIKMLMFVTMCVVILAARGMHVFIKRKPSAGNIAALVFWIAALAVGSGLMYVGFKSGAFPQFHLTSLWSQLLWRNGEGLLYSAAIGVVCMVLWWLRRIGTDTYFRIAASLLIAGMVALFAWDATLFNKHAGPADYYTRPSLVAELLRKLSEPEGSLWRSALVYETPHAPKEALEPGDRTIAVYRYARLMMSPQTNIPLKMDNVLDFVVGQTQDNSILWHIAKDEYMYRGNSIPLGVFSRMSSVKIMGSELGVINAHGSVGDWLVKPDARFFQPVYRSSKYNLALYRVIDSLPRAYFAPKVAWGAPHKAVLTHIGRPDKSGFDPLKLTILEHSHPGETGPALNVTPDSIKQSSAKFIVDEPDFVRLAVTTPTDNFLILTDQYYPGWHATVDGQPAQIYPANILFRAVLVPAGQHTVEFRYAPNSLRWGLLLSALAIVGILGLLVAAALVRTRRES